jgi:hypothetical protein
MGNEPLQEIKRGEHRVPRWISMLWLAIVASLALTSIVMAVRLGSDLVRTLGFLVISCMAIFALSAFAYLALYGFSILLEGLDYHKAHCDDSKHWAGMVDFMR